MATCTAKSGSLDADTGLSCDELAGLVAGAAAAAEHVGGQLVEPEPRISPEKSLPGFRVERNPKKRSAAWAGALENRRSRPRSRSASSSRRFMRVLSSGCTDSVA